MVAGLIEYNGYIKLVRGCDIMEGLFSDIAKYSDEKLIDDIAGVVSLSRKFSGDYNLSILEIMSMEDYAIGHGDNLNFCYRIEWELGQMGEIGGPAGPRQFGVWYSKKDGEYHYTEKFGSSLEEAWMAVKTEIINLVKAGAKEDYAAIKKSMLPPLFRYKILAVYYPDQYITIFSEKHLSYFCGKLEIPLLSGDDTLTLQRKLILWKDQHYGTKEMSLVMYVKWLYDTLGRPPKTEWISEHKSKLKILYKDLEAFDKKYPEAKKVEVLQQERSEKVAAYVKERANGVCQLCNKPAPFYNKIGEPFLECHHVVWIAKGGIDEPSNVVALCPNCHRKMHILDIDEDVQYLKKKAKKK